MQFTVHLNSYKLWNAIFLFLRFDEFFFFLNLFCWFFLDDTSWRGNARLTNEVKVLSLKVVWNLEEKRRNLLKHVVNIFAYWKYFSLKIEHTLTPACWASEIIFCLFSSSKRLTLAAAQIGAIFSSYALFSSSIIFRALYLKWENLFLN